MSSFNLRNSGRPIRVCIILTQSKTEILDISPIDVLTGIAKESMEAFPDEFISPDLKAQALEFEWHWVNQTGKPASLTSGAHVNITDTFTTCPPLDITIMGANVMQYQPSKEELAFVRKTYDECSAFLTICAGMVVPLQAGIPAGKSATAPHLMLQMLQKQQDEGNVPEDQKVKWSYRRWQVSEDGKLWTSGTLLNGMDMMRDFAHRTWGGEGSLMDKFLDIGAWPVRDVNYRPMVVKSEA